MLQKKRFQIVLDYRKIGIEIYFIGIGSMKKIDPRRNTKKFNDFLNKKFTKVCEVCVREVCVREVVGSQSVRSRSVRSRNGRIEVCESKWSVRKVSWYHKYRIIIHI